MFIQYTYIYIYTSHVHGYIVMYSISVLILYIHNVYTIHIELLTLICNILFPLLAKSTKAYFSKESTFWLVSFKQLLQISSKLGAIAHKNVEREVLKFFSLCIYIYIYHVIDISYTSTWQSYHPPWIDEGDHSSTLWDLRCEALAVGFIERHSKVRGFGFSWEPMGQHTPGCHPIPGNEALLRDYKPPLDQHVVQTCRGNHHQLQGGPRIQL